MLRARASSFALLTLLIGASFQCASAPRRFALRVPLWTDNDTRPIHHRPHEYYSPLIWDGADHMVLRPLTHALQIETGREAVNVNALDEVPDSSWYTNRLSIRRLTAEDMFEGACTEHPAPDPHGTWTLLRSKENGWFPGFLARGPDGHRYVMKADGVLQSEQTSAGDIVGSRIFWAAGYYAPCNRSIRINADQLHIGPDAHYEDSAGDEHPMTQAQIDAVLAHSRRYEDGSYRLGISLFVEGEPLGPFRYEETRHDDPNDVVPHEDRRDLRGARLLSAWINHYDSREQNTLTTWIDTGQHTGYVRHYMIDFGDALGSVWANDGLSRRLGYSGYFEADHVVLDFLTLGLLDRPWDHVQNDPQGWIFGYFNESPFDPAAWRPAYQNPAYARMTERDGAWMARIVARFTDDDVRAIVRAANLTYAPWSETLERTLLRRRDLILARYLTRLSSLADVAIEGQRICASDRAVEARLYAHARYHAEWLPDGNDEHVTPLGDVINDGTNVCFPLPPVAPSDHPQYGVLRIITRPENRDEERPLEIHTYALPAATGYVVAGLER